MEWSLVDDLDKGACGTSNVLNEELAIIEVDSGMVSRYTLLQNYYLVGGVSADVATLLLQRVKDAFRTVDLLNYQFHSLLLRVVLTSWTWFFERCKLLLLFHYGSLIQILSLLKLVFVANESLHVRYDWLTTLDTNFCYKVVVLFEADVNP